METHYQINKAEYISRAKKWAEDNPEKTRDSKLKYGKSGKGKLCIRRYCQTFKGYLFRKWWSIKQRCDNPKDKRYKYYGGRGIKCLFESVNDFRNHVINDLGYNTFEKIKGLEIDRINNDGNYESGNIQFVTHKENCNNRKKADKNKRLISPRQEEALRCCHHEFEGLTQSEAAKKMNISQSALSKLLTAVKKVLPQYFPILTKLEAKCHHFYMVCGQSVAYIARQMDKPQSTVHDALQRVRVKGLYSTKTKCKMLSYNPSMDINVKLKF